MFRPPVGPWAVTALGLHFLTALWDNSRSGGDSVHVKLLEQRLFRSEPSADVNCHSLDRQMIRARCQPEKLIQG